MNDEKIRALLSEDKSAPKAPNNELLNIHQKIEDNKFSFNFFFQMKGLALASIFVAVIFISQVSTQKQNTNQISEIEQQQLIEYYLEDNYLDNIESSYAWIDIEATLTNQ